MNSFDIKPPLADDIKILSKVGLKSEKTVILNSSIFIALQGSHFIRSCNQVQNCRFFSSYRSFGSHGSRKNKNDADHNNQSSNNLDNDFNEDSMKYWEHDIKQADTNVFHNGVTEIDFTKKQSCDKHLTHVDESGKAKMVDFSDKPVSARSASACATIHLGNEAFHLVRENKIKKGDVLTVAQIAGIMAAKNTSQFIPLCHNISLSKVDINMDLDENSHSLHIVCKVKSTGKTGVEMEAITGATMAAVTVYDMCKAVTREMVISNVRLLHKVGGVRGDYHYRQ